MMEKAPYHRSFGMCPICGTEACFVSDNSWLRDALMCLSCAESVSGSVVRERAIYRAFELFAIDPANLRVHEIAPGGRGASIKLQREAKSYTASNFFPSKPPGEIIEGMQNENAERQSFGSGVFDLVVHLDILEHVNEPHDVMRECARTLAPGGWCVFTTPTYKDILRSRRVGFIAANGTEAHIEPPEYHGNPISNTGSLVTWRFGYDLGELIPVWSGMDVTVLRFVDKTHGLLGEFTETYVCRKAA